MMDDRLAATKAQDQLSYQRIEIKELKRKLNQRSGLFKENEQLKNDLNALDELIAEMLYGEIIEEDFVKFWKSIIKEKYDPKEWQR